jgi:polyisoprenoid-binding protein YceI
VKTTYKIDPAHSSAQFAVRHMMITNVRGAFNNLQGTVAYDPQNPSASSVDVIIDAKTINTLEADRDAHLKSADFLDVEKFPNITFKSSTATGMGTAAWT